MTQTLTDSTITLPAWQRWLMTLKLLANRRLLVTLLLGFASGLPLALTTTTLQAWYTKAGVDLVTIGMLTLTGQPYIYKFLWSPLMDRFVPPLFGRRRGWILVMQLLLIAGISWMALGNPAVHADKLALLALCVAFFSASQDIAIDAYRTDLLLPEERSLGAAMTTAGYRIGMVVSGGIALIMAAYWGWRNTYLCMAALMTIGVLAVLWGPEIEHAPKPPTRLWRAVVEPFKEFLQRPQAWLLLLLILTYKLSEAFMTAMSMPFLIRGVGFDLVDVGTVNKVMALLATIAGAFIGGVYVKQRGIYRGLVVFIILQAGATLSYALLAWVGHNYTLMVLAIGLENLFVGMSVAAVLALLMALCDARYTATQYALFSALAALGRVYSGTIAGYIVEHLGWTGYFVMTALIAVPTVMLLWYLRNTIKRYC